jgi:hypothetical protein
MECRVFDISCHNIESMAHNLCETIAILKSLGVVGPNRIRSRGRNSSVGWPLASGISYDQGFFEGINSVQESFNLER